MIVEPGTPPDIVVIPNEGQQNPEKLLVIEAFVFSELAFGAVWSSVSGEGQLGGEG